MEYRNYDASSLSSSPFTLGGRCLHDYRGDCFGDVRLRSATVMTLASTVHAQRLSARYPPENEASDLHVTVPPL